MASAALRDTLTLKKEEEALIHLMKSRAVKQCTAEQKAYAECVSGRMLSVAWACREPAQKMSDCLTSFTDAAALEALKQRWVAAGKPNLATNPQF